MIGGEFSRWDASATAVWPNFVVVPSPRSDDFSGLGQRSEPVLVEAFVTQLAIEALDVVVVRWPARLYQQIFDVMPLSPGDEGTVGELGPIVGSYRAGITAEAGRPIQHANYIGPAVPWSTASTLSWVKSDAFVGEGAGDGQVLESTPIGERITDEAHAADHVGLACW